MEDLWDEVRALISKRTQALTKEETDEYVVYLIDELHMFREGLSS